MNKKERIENATITLLLEKGVSASISEIIQRAGISKGGFYHYYATKQQLLKESIQHYFDDRWHLLEKITHSDQPYFTKIESLIEALFDPYKKASKQMSHQKANYLSLLNEYVKISELKDNYKQFHLAVKETIEDILTKNEDKFLIADQQSFSNASNQILYLTEGILFNSVINDIDDVIRRCKAEVREYLKLISK